ncbi:alpha-amylase family glycosyl hydrolase [Rufibacter sp. LB8]|uniref:alpha-amylase family glycosyl hydrolase n=1 Tax=Rufibacter sp. LB8 TaxID=2777781 RepID=UPI00178C73B5|nr:alpha-amylase family glycosyl hydrolase [Rufibacter sp. LB8]
MKQLSLLVFLFLFSPLVSLGQQVPLTFRVDMRQQNVSTAGVHVAGTFQSDAGFGSDWNPATTRLQDPDNDQIFELTVQVPAGVYEYKFVNGNSWNAGPELVSADCGKADGAGNVNRQVTVGTSGVRLPVVPFNGCSPQLTLSVDMGQQTVSPMGVHVAGNFQVLAGYGTDWSPNSLPLTDPDGDRIYDVTISLPTGGLFQYKFINGNTLANAEVVPVACGVEAGQGVYHRTIDATSNNTISPTYVFGTCTRDGVSIPNTNYTTHWWNDAVFYEIFVRSFYDSNGDGKGDFKGLIQKLDYLNDGNPDTKTDLGITGIWLMPMMESPSYHGYDVTNYYATESDYGTMAEFEEFLAAAHARGIKVIIDFVMNHSSDQHSWFTQSASSTSNALRDWYVWSATNPGYTGPWGQGVWHPRNGNYFYGLFYSGMPDLNWSNAQLKATMWDITRFWLNKGVDGYRIDAVKYLDEDGARMENTPETFQILEEFNQVTKSAKATAFTVGEAWSSTASVVPYVENNRLDVCFEFDLAATLINSVKNNSPATLKTQLSLVNQLYPKLQYATFLSNHDQNRVLGELNGNLAQMKQAAALYLTMPGVPFLYYGEEIGMLGAGVDEDKRKPMQWTSDSKAGFTTGTPWRAVNSNAAQFNVQTMANDPASLLQHYKKLIHLRNDVEALRKGYYQEMSSTQASMLSYARIYDGKAAVVVSNFGSEAVASPTVSLAVSSLPAGVYAVTEGYSNQAMGQVTLNDQGGFSNWTITGGVALGADQTWILLLNPTTLASAREIEKSISFAIYPNPAQTQAVLQMERRASDKTTISVYDATGKMLQTTPWVGEKHVLSTQALADGIYFVKVQSGKHVSMQRLVVQH